MLWWVLAAALGAEPAWTCLGREPLDDVWRWVGARPPRRLLPDLPEHADTCWGQLLAERVVRDHVIVEHPSEVPATLAASLADAFERSLEAEVDTLGWRAPPGADRWRLAVYLNQAELPGAATAREPCGGLSMPLIVVPVSALPDDATLAEVAAHEAHHAVQAAYDDGAPFWLWEASATWMEALVVPTDGWLRFVEAWARAPELGLDEGDRRVPDELLHMYGRAAWLRQVEAEHGQIGVRSLWEAAADLGGPRFSLSLPPIAASSGLDLPESVASFGVAMAEEAVVGSRGYPPIAASAVDAQRPTGERFVGGWAQTHLDVSPDAAGDREIVLEGDDAQRWSAAVADEAGEVQRSDWVRSLTLPLPRGAARVVVSRLHPSGGTLSWTVARVDPDDSPTPEDTDDAPPVGGCGCTSGGPGGWWVGGWLLAACIRRRPQAGVATAQRRW